MNRRRFLKKGALCSGVIGACCSIGGHSSVLFAQNDGQPVKPVPIDLTDAVVVAPESLSRREQKAVQLLVEEVEKRTELRWPIVHRLESGARPAIVVGSDQSLKKDGVELPRELVTVGGKLASS